MNAPLPVEAQQIHHVGVIGAGQMGSGISQVCAAAGLDVVMLDSRAEALAAGLSTIGKNLDRQVTKGTLTAEAKAEILGRVATTQEYAAFADCDLVVEAATEKEELKKTIFKTLVPHVKPGCIIASNTSSISITRLAAVTDRPAQFIGIHFLNPVVRPARGGTAGRTEPSKRGPEPAKNVPHATKLSAAKREEGPLPERAKCAKFVVASR